MLTLSKFKPSFCTKRNSKFFLSGLRFELLEDGVSVIEDVGTVELCVSYKGSNVPPTINATIHYRNFYGCKCIASSVGLVMSIVTFPIACNYT